MNGGLMMDLKEIRYEIDKIDEELKRLFYARMDLVLKVAKYKKDNNLKVLDNNREKEMFERLVGDDELSAYYHDFLKSYITISKQFQSVKILSKD